MNGFRLVVLLFVFTVVVAVRAEDTNTLPTTITVDGITYSNVTWRTVTPATVTIFHETGVASIPLEKLPPELQRRFGYDPQRAATYRAQESVATQQHLVEMQAREQLRQQHEAEALEAARKQQEAQAAEQAREQLAASQKANANNNVEVIQVLHVDGAINALATGGYVAQLALTNHTTVCSYFDEGGKRYLEDANRKYTDWMTQQDSGGQQLQVSTQPGAILLYGGKGGVRVPGGGSGFAYTMGGSQPASTSSPPVAVVFAVREENSSCYSLKGNREAGQMGGIKQYSW
jgi:uncharacterized Zn ribbon protein